MSLNLAGHSRSLAGFGRRHRLVSFCTHHVHLGCKSVCGQLPGVVTSRYLYSSKIQPFCCLEQRRAIRHDLKKWKELGRKGKKTRKKRSVLRGPRAKERICSSTQALESVGNTVCFSPESVGNSVTNQEQMHLCQLSFKQISFWNLCYFSGATLKYDILEHIPFLALERFAFHKSPASVRESCSNVYKVITFFKPI